MLMNNKFKAQTLNRKSYWKLHYWESELTFGNLTTGNFWKFANQKVNTKWNSEFLSWIGILTLKRPGLCGWLRPTQFKPRLDWLRPTRLMFSQPMGLLVSHNLVLSACAKRWPFCHSVSLLDYENHRCYVSINSNNNQDKHRYGTSFNESVNSSPPGQNSLRFADNLFKCIFTNEKLRIFGSNFTEVCS